MLTHEENDLLCRVEGDAPMGQLMRRHWVPAALSEQVSEPDGAPVRLRLFGEDLVAFRDTDGRLGVLGEHCPHRKASLALGRNEECGLRCLYHGWKFDVEGNVLEMASEPAESRFAEKVKHKAYPTRGMGRLRLGLYGRKRAQARFRAAALGADAGHQGQHRARSTSPATGRRSWKGRSIRRIRRACTPPTCGRRASIRPRRPTRIGCVRRPTSRRSSRSSSPITASATPPSAGRSATPTRMTYVRITTYVAPFTALIPPNTSYNVATVIVPKDDTSSYFHFIAWHDSAGIDQEAWRKFCVAQVGIDLDSEYRVAAPEAQQQLPAGSPGHEARQLHRHPRHPQPGHRHVGDDGADRRPHQRAPRRQRHGGGAVPPR